MYNIISTECIYLACYAIPYSMTHENLGFFPDKISWTCAKLVTRYADVMLIGLASIQYIYIYNIQTWF